MQRVFNLYQPCLGACFQKKLPAGGGRKACRDPDHLVYYDRYEIAAYLQTGENVIGIMLGDGFLNGKTKTWDFCDNVFRSGPKLAMAVSIDCNGKHMEFHATKRKGAGEVEQDRGGNPAAGNLSRNS